LQTLKRLRSPKLLILTELKSERVLEILRETLDGLDREMRRHILGLALFGSLARGEGNPRSDIDLFILTRGLSRGVERRRIIYEALYPVVAKSRRDLTIVDVGVEELKSLRPSSLLLNIAYDAVIIHDPKGILGRLFKAIRETLKRYDIIRYRLPDGSYAFRPRGGGRMPRMVIRNWLR